MAIKNPAQRQLRREVKNNHIPIIGGAKGEIKMEFELTDNIKKLNETKCRQIRYLDKSLGGFIENRSNLSESAIILGNAVVSGNAVVRGNAEVGKNAVVGENAVVRGSAWVGGNAVVRGNAVIRGDAVVEGYSIIGGNVVIEGNTVIDGDARIFSNDDYMTVHGLRSANCTNRTITFYKNSKNGIGVSWAYFSGTLDEFREKARKTYGDSKYAKEYLMAADLAEYHLLYERRGNQDGTEGF